MEIVGLFSFSVSIIADISLPSSSWLPSTSSTYRVYMTAILSSIEEVREVDPRVVSATNVGLGSISSSGVK